MSAAYQCLHDLAVGDVVPAECYVLDHADGERPRWTVHELEERGSKVLRLVLIDPDNGAWNLLDDGERVALQVLTWPAKTLRTQPYMLGHLPAGILCDLDQQARRVAGKDIMATDRSEP